LWAHAGRPLPFVVERDGQQVSLQSTIPMPTNEGGWLGVFLDEGDPNIKGARVTQVYPAGPAARGGLHIGDIITQIDAKPITHSADAVMLIRELQPKSEVVLTVVRGKEEEKVTVTVGSRNNSIYQSFYGGSQHQNFQGGQQPGDPNSFQQFNGVPPYAMQLENDRRMAEQHERIEEEIRLLREEIQKLREALQKK
jgi:membrane-associated protease RseP (regulator of RpoE activity)